MNFRKFRNKGIILGFCLISLLMFVVFVQAENDDEIKRLQAEITEKGFTYTVGITPVSKIPLKKLCGLVEPPDWRETGVFDGVTEGPWALALPSSFDWRTQGKVTPVKNQGSCGSCWAFGTMGSYEAAIMVGGGPEENLSEQYLLDCNSHGYSCSGGWWVFDDMYNGVPKESCYPYVAYKQSCQSGCTKYYPMDSWYYVGSSSGVPTSSAIKQAIYDHGPVAAAVYASSAIQNYTGGIFNNCQSGTVNHAIVLVGWDDGGGYWIMKNSWGTGWGESGYMRITYGCNQIGYAAAYGIPSGGTPPPPPEEDPYEPNDSPAAAYGPIDSGEDYANAEISTSSDVDWFHFTTEDTGTITVSVTHESGEDLDWYLYKSTDTVNWVARGYTVSNPEVGSYQADWIGKYYVRVVGYSGSTSTYTLRVTYPDTPGGGATYYRLMNRYSGYALDINTGSSYVYHYAYNGGYDKHWEIIDLGTGYYRLKNRSNGNDLDVGSTNYAYNYVWNGNTDKQWQIIDLGTGYYRLKNRYNGYDLDVGSGNYVYVYVWNGNTDKQWQIIAVE